MSSTNPGRAVATIEGRSFYFDGSTWSYPRSFAHIGHALNAAVAEAQLRHATIVEVARRCLWFAGLEGSVELAEQPSGPAGELPAGAVE